MSRIIHVVGTGTIGEPLIGLLADFRKEFGIDEVTFHKRTPLQYEVAKVNSLIGRGAGLCVTPDVRAEFEALGHAVSYDAREAIERATVVIDCTPAGNANKAELYDHIPGPLGFVAQGSEFGFGKMYARGINDDALDRDADRFIHVVSCNTHNLAALIKSIAGTGNGGPLTLDSASFVCVRRANDLSQDGNFIPAPQVGGHGDPRFGTHHARDAHHLFETLGMDLSLFSSAMKVNSQYMHQVWFDLRLSEDVNRDLVLNRLRENPRVALTWHKSANRVFSFGRDHGYHGRILSQTVVPAETLTVPEPGRVVGWSFTPQDGNSLVSSIAAALWFMYPEGFQERIDALQPYVFREV